MSEILVRHRNDNPGFVVTLFDRNFKIALSLVKAHREKLALLAGDEQPLNVEIVNPVTNVPAQAMPRLAKGLR